MESICQVDEKEGILAMSPEILHYDNLLTSKAQIYLHLVKALNWVEPEQVRANIKKHRGPFMKQVGETRLICSGIDRWGPS